MYIYARIPQIAEMTPSFHVTGSVGSYLEVLGLRSGNDALLQLWWNVVALKLLIILS